jgi:hypothetical protein
MTTSLPKKLAKAEAMRRAAVQGRRFLTDHPHGAAETLILDMATAAERATLTIPNWWAAYAVSAGLYHSLIKSTPEERRGFCDWLEAQVPRRPPARSVPVAKPKRPRRVLSDEQKAERRRRKQSAKLAKGLDALAMQYGRDSVAAWLAAWLNGPETTGFTLVGE